LPPKAQFAQNRSGFQYRNLQCRLFHRHATTQHSGETRGRMANTGAEGAHLLLAGQLSGKRTEGRTLVQTLTSDVGV